MKAYQFTIATVVASVVVAMYAVITSRPDLLVRAVGALVIQAVVLVYCLQKNKEIEDRAYANKYKTVTTTRVIDASEVPAEIVARMEANMGWDLEGFEASLKPVVLEKSDLPFEIFVKDFEMMENDPLNTQLDSVLRELDSMVDLPPAPKQECYVL